MPCLAVFASTGFQLRVCTGKVCKKQGSPQVAQFGRDLGLAAVEVQSCGCLGSCGAGPNVAVVPLDGSQPLLLRHVGTPRRMADLLRDVCAQQVDDALLKATELRLAGNEAARRGDLRRADALYSEGLELQPPHGSHLLLSNRSSVRLELGDAEAALRDADAAAAHAPPDFVTAAVRQVEALVRLGRPDDAWQRVAEAREARPAWGRTEECHRLAAGVQAALHAAGQRALT